MLLRYQACPDVHNSESTGRSTSDYSDLYCKKIIQFQCSHSVSPLFFHATSTRSTRFSSYVILKYYSRCWTFSFEIIDLSPPSSALAILLSNKFTFYFPPSPLASLITLLSTGKMVTLKHDNFALMEDNFFNFTPRQTIFFPFL